MRTIKGSGKSVGGVVTILEGHINDQRMTVSDTSGASGEFSLSGQAKLIDNPEIRTLAVKLALYSPAEHYILFELRLESVASTLYEGDRIIRQQRRMVRG